MTDEPPPPDRAATTTSGDDWGSAAQLPVPAGAHEPTTQRLAIRIENDLVHITGDDPASIVAIHNRQALSNDIQKITLNISFILLLITGSLIFVFGPTNKNTTAYIGGALFVAAAGLFGYKTLSFKGPGISATLGQTTTAPASSSGWLKFFGGLIVGGVLAGAAFAVWQHL